MSLSWKSTAVFPAASPVISKLRFPGGNWQFRFSRAERIGVVAGSGVIAGVEFGVVTKGGAEVISVAGMAIVVVVVDVVISGMVMRLVVNIVVGLDGMTAGDVGVVFCS